LNQLTNVNQLFIFQSLNSFIKKSFKKYHKYPVQKNILNPIYSADGNYEVTLITKANVYHNGLVNWVPPAVYKSSCSIDVEVRPKHQNHVAFNFL
jgi:hypothetical protein